MTENLKESVPFYLVDVFTDVKYGGNQLAVFIDLQDQFDKDHMQAIAKEIGFSEVSFIKEIQEEQYFTVRIFTPEYEVPFAGHPALGTAYVIVKHLMENPSRDIFLKLPIG